MAKSLPSPFTIFPPPLISQLDSIFWAYNNTKFSFAQISHRSEHYGTMNTKSQQSIKSYFQVPQNYHIIYLSTKTAFAALPFNLNRFVNNSSMYLVNDAQSELAFKQSLKLNEKTVKISNLSNRKQIALTLSDKPFYYYTYYNKISIQTGDVQQQLKPLQGQILVCNLNYCSHYEKINVKNHGIVFFESGRGFGISGMTVMIVRKDLVGFQLNNCPDMMSFEKSIKTNSIINTPYTWVPLIFLQYINYCHKQNKTMTEIKKHLSSIKKQYTDAISTKTSLVETKAQGIIKFKLPSNVSQDSINELGWKIGDYLVIMLQEENEGKSQDFINKIFHE